MKLLMVTNDWPPIEGGIATVSVETARALARRGHRVTVLAPALVGAGSADHPPGLELERWRGYGLGYLRWFPSALATLSHARRVDAVLAMNAAYGGLMAALMSLVGGPPYVTWAYGYELLRRRPGRGSRLYGFVFGHASRVIAISAYTRQLLLDLRVDDRRIVMLNPGVAPPKKEPLDGVTIRHRYNLDDGPIVLTVGRLVERKGHLRLLDALERLNERHPTLHWVVVGRGPEDQRLRRAVEMSPLRDRIRLLGHIDDEALDALYRLATLFALTPTASSLDAEGFGLVFLEAGAHALPVVAGRSGGISDAVEDGVTGVLVDPDDSTVIARAIGSLLEDPLYARTLGEGGKARAEAGSWDAMASQLERLLGDTA